MHINQEWEDEISMSNIVLREDFLVKKILLSKSEIRQEKDLAKKEKLFEHQDKLVEYLLAESDKASESKDLDRMKAMVEKLKAILKWKNCTEKIGYFEKKKNVLVKYANFLPKFRQKTVEIEKTEKFEFLCLLCAHPNFFVRQFFDVMLFSKIFFVIFLKCSWH